MTESSLSSGLTAELPTGRRGQIVAIAVMLVAVLALWLLIISPIAGFYSDRSDELAERQRVEQHMEQLVASRQDLEARAAELGDTAPPPNILDGSSIPVATAALQGIAKDVAASAGASLTSVESLPGETGAGYRRVGVKLSLTTSWPVLIHFMESLQQSDTPMAIDDLQIHTSAQGGQASLVGPAGKSGASEQQQLFDAGFTIHAPASADAPAQADKTPGAGPAEPPRDSAPAPDATAPDTATPDAGPADAPAGAGPPHQDNGK
jgi:general secretion pathway protein M